MKRLWPYWSLPLLHFAVVTAAAFAVHYSNGINVGGFSGAYGVWMDSANLGNDIFQFTRWAFPVVLIFVLLRAKDKKKEAVWFGAAVSSMIVATWPTYLGLIHFWERNWYVA